MSILGKEVVIISPDETRADILICNGKGYSVHYVRRVKVRKAEPDGRKIFELEPDPQYPDLKY